MWENCTQSLQHIVDTFAHWGGAETLLGGLGAHYSTLYSFARTVNSTVMKPIAYEILALFLVLELAKICMKVAENGTNGMVGIGEMIKFAIRFGLSKAVIDNNQNILAALFYFSQQATEKLSGLGSNPTWATAALQSAVQAQRNAGFFQLMALWITLNVTAFICSFLLSTVKIFIAIRFIQLYCLYAFAPIPLATCMNEGQYNMCPSFLKNYLGSCFHGTVIYFVLKAAGYLLADIVVTGAGTFPCCISLITGCVVIFMCLSSAERTAMRIFGGG